MEPLRGSGCHAPGGSLLGDIGVVFPVLHRLCLEESKAVTKDMQISARFSNQTLDAVVEGLPLTLPGGAATA